MTSAWQLHLTVGSASGLLPAPDLGRAGDLQLLKATLLYASRYSKYSLRFGFPASASVARVGMEAWMPHTRLKSVKVAMDCVKRGALFSNNPTAQMGL